MPSRHRYSGLGQLLRPGTASNYIKTLSDCPTTAPAVLWLRVSHRSQAAHLDAADAFLTRELEARGSAIVGRIRHVGNGARFDDGNVHFTAAIELARQEGALLVAESTDRFLRHDFYSRRHNRMPLPTEMQFRFLAQVTSGVNLATYLHPDATPAEVQKHQIRRSREFSGAQGGRPPHAASSQWAAEQTRLLSLLHKRLRAP